jgi:hypothetical protein
MNSEIAHSVDVPLAHVELCSVNSVVVGELVLGVELLLQGAELSESPGLVSVLGLKRLVSETVVGVSGQLALGLTGVPDVTGLLAPLDGKSVKLGVRVVSEDGGTVESC